MKKKVAVLVVHGIGWHDDGRPEDLVDHYITGLMDPPKSVALLEGALAEHLDGVAYDVRLAHWGLRLEKVQTAFAKRTRNLRWTRARRVAISALGDAAQYCAAVYRDGKQTFPAHAAVHEVVVETLGKLAESCGRDAPLVAIGHSLGGHIISNHIYDQQSRGLRHGAGTPLERMETLRALVTLGCNIPLFVMGVHPPTPIRLDRFDPHTKWRNYYDPDDALGYPLMPLYFPDGKPPSGFDLEDIEVEVGGLVTGSTPLSHGFYWNNPTVARGIAALVREAAR